MSFKFILHSIYPRVAYHSKKFITPKIHKNQLKYHARKYTIITVTNYVNKLIIIKLSYYRSCQIYFIQYCACILYTINKSV